MTIKTRLEKDSLGIVEVDNSKYWGAQTQRSLTNFKIGPKMHKDVIHAFGYQKQASTQANLELGILSSEFANAISKAAAEVSSGKLDDHFPLVVFQTGSGTQTNMNANEVIANRANEILGYPLGSKDHIHPNDHVNQCQSSNDSFPTVMHIATVLAAKNSLFPSLEKLLDVFTRKAIDYAMLVKIGRTHLQDATPITLGQEFSGYASQLSLNLIRIEKSLEDVSSLAQGGTAVGTGINSHRRFAEMFIQKLNSLTGVTFKEADNKFEALAAHDALVAFSGSLNTLAVSLMKIANDIRLLASGPRCGFGELFLPENEPGSSIMPGKVNPTQAEALTMVCTQVMGNHMTITIAGSQGHLELNVFKPVIIDNILASIHLLSQAMESFATNCIEGLEVNQDKITEHLENSLMLVTSLSPHIGYDKSAEIAKKAHHENTTLRAAALNSGLLNEQQFNEWVNPLLMIKPS